MRRGLNVPGQQGLHTAKAAGISASKCLCIDCCSLFATFYSSSPHLTPTPHPTCLNRQFLSESPQRERLSVHVLVFNIPLHICRDSGAATCFCDPRQAVICCWLGQRATGRAADWQRLLGVATNVASGVTASIQQHQAPSSTGPTIGDLAAPHCHTTERRAQTPW